MMAHTPGTPAAPAALDGQPPAEGARRRGEPAATAQSSLLDRISMQIIEQLQQDGRRSYAAIGKAVGLSEAAVRQRVQRLLEAGVMQIVAVTDPLTLGFHRQTMIGVKCEGDPERVGDLLPEILSRVRTVPSVTSTETFMYLKLRKQTYSWGTR